MKEIVIVTGASSGIGRSTAEALSQKGFAVFAGVRRQKDWESWETTQVRPIFLDVTSDESVGQAMETLAPALAGAGKVHLVNNAGIAVAGPVEAVSLERWKEQFEVNVFGLVRVTKKLLPVLRRTRGRIVNISSISGLATSPYLGPYSSSKFAVEAISDALRRELRQFGVEVVIVEPGPIDTPIWEKNFSGGLQGLETENMPPYAEMMEAFERSARESARTSMPATQVSSVILRALTAKRPRTRYLVSGKGLAMQAGLAGFLPDRWLDAMIERSLR